MIPLAPSPESEGVSSARLAAFVDGQLKDITYRQWFLLTMIERMPRGEKSINDIADFAGTTRQNVRTLVTALENKGFVQVMPSKRDARALTVSLTRKAKRCLAANAETMDAVEDKLFSQLSPAEVDHLVSGLSKLLAATETECPDTWG